MVKEKKVKKRKKASPWASPTLPKKNIPIAKVPTWMSQEVSKRLVSGL